MVRSAFLVCCLLMNVVACAANGADATFEEALNAARHNDWETLAQAQAQLAEDHPLRAYLDFHRLRAALPELDPERVRAYQQRYPDSPLPSDIRNLALVSYAKHDRWDAVRALGGSAPQAVELRCYYLRARADTERQQVLADTRELWLTGRSRPSSCDPLFDAAREAGVIGQKEIWERMQLAFDEGSEGLMRHLRPMLHGPNESAGDWLMRLYQDPRQVRNLPSDLSGPQRQLLLSAGLRRLADKDTVQAREIYQDDSRSLGLIDNAARLSAATRIAWYSTIRGIEENQEWLDRWLAENNNQTLLEQRARRAVIEQHWRELPQWIARLSPEAQADSRWLYWLGRAEAENGDQEQAKSHWQQAARQRNFYAFLAADRIGQPYSFSEETVSRVGEDSVKPPAFTRVRMLRELDEPGLAWKEWNWLMLHSGDTERRQLAQQALDQGWYDLTVQASIQAQTWNVLAWRFPLAHEDLFIDAGRRHHLDPWLAMAVARRESAFYPNARSPVGALGLMQLMPGTARKVARDQGQSAPEIKQLLQPATNIDMGSHYLAEVLDKFNGNRLLALAAYNAGPNRIPRWLPDQDDAVPFDVWIESIPFYETREYVQAVLTYRVLFLGLHDPKKRTAQLLHPKEQHTPYSTTMIE